MRRIVAIGVFLLAAFGAAAAQVPEKLSFQGRLTDAASAPVNGSVSITFRIYDTATAGSLQWTEAQTVAVTNGIYAVYLADTTPFPAGLFDSQVWLSVQVGTDLEMTPRYRLAASPYSIRAVTATNLAGLTTPISQLNQLNGLSANVTAANLNTLTGGGNGDALHVHDWAAITGKPAVAVTSSTNTFNQINTFSAPQSFTVATGTAPFTVVSTTQVSNLNAQFVNGLSSSVFAQLGGNQTFTGANAFSNAPDFNVAQGIAPFTVASTTKVVNLNADTVDGLDSTAFAPAVHDHAGGAWTTPAGAGLTVTTTSAVAGAVGLFGIASNASVTNFGVYGSTNSPTGYGLYTPNRAFVGGTLNVGGVITGNGSGLTGVTPANGTVTPSKVATFPKARCELSSTVSIPSATWTDVPFTTETYDTDAFHDNVTNAERFVPPISGYYRVHAQATFRQNSVGNRGVEIWGQFGSYARHWVPGGNGAVLAATSVTSTIFLSAGQWLRMVVWQDSGAPLLLGDSTPAESCFFEIQYIP
jgi:hypothetical protein